MRERRKKKIRLLMDAVGELNELRQASEDLSDAVSHGLSRAISTLCTLEKRRLANEVGVEKFACAAKQPLYDIPTRKTLQQMVPSSLSPAVAVSCNIAAHA